MKATTTKKRTVEQSSGTEARPKRKRQRTLLSKNKPLRFTTETLSCPSSVFSLTEVTIHWFLSFLDAFCFKS